MSTVKIARIEDIRLGDHVTLVWNGDATATVSGTVRSEGSVRYLVVADRPFLLGDGPQDWHVAVATREVPDAPPLPTEPGSVIVNATIRGEAGHTAFLDDGGAWRSLRLASGYYFHDPEHVTAWEPARIVPEGGAS